MALVLATAALAADATPLLAQRRAGLEVTPPTTASPMPVVAATNLFGDSELRDLVRSGFPASLRFRLELWRVGGVFNDLEGRQEWELVIQYDPSAERYRLLRRQGERFEDAGSFATLSTAQAVLERPVRVGLLPERAGARYYYNFTLNIEALSVSDMDQVERWLRGVHGNTAASAVGNGMRTLMLRMLGGESQRLERRSASFVTAG